MPFAGFFLVFAFLSFTSRSVHGWMDQIRSDWIDRWMDGWMDGRTDRWVNRWMDGWTSGWDGWIDEQRKGGID